MCYFKLQIHTVTCFNADLVHTIYKSDLFFSILNLKYSIVIVLFFKFTYATDTILQSTKLCLFMALYGLLTLVSLPSYL